MKASVKKLNDVYNAISDTVMEYRLARKSERKSSIVSNDIDADLFYLTNRIWDKVESVIAPRGAK